MKRRIPWFELCLLAGVALLGFTIWKSVAPKPPPIVVDTGLDPATMSPNYRYPGLVIAPVPVEWGGDSEWIAGMIDMEMWKFVTKQTATKSNYSFQLEVREKKKATRVLMTIEFGGVSFSSNTQTKRTLLFVAIMPINGSMSSAATIKCKIGTGSSSSSMTVENPFKKYSSSGSPQVGSNSGQPDIPLWETRFGSGYLAPRIRTLFLKIIPKSAATY